MDEPKKNTTNKIGGLSGFGKFAVFTLLYNIVVILWGVFLRASKSGDGCGQFWLTCHGEIIPSAPEFKTVIEFTHRITSGIAFLIVVALLFWIYRKYKETGRKDTQLLYVGIGSFVFILTEALVGAGLVLTGNTADTLTAARPYWAIGHLINTFILLTFLTLTAWFAVTGRRLKNFNDKKMLALLTIAVIGILFVGMSGALAALSNMLFPSESLAEGFAKDFADTSHVLLRLRLSHPILSFLVSVYIFLLAGWLKPRSGNNAGVTYWSNALSLLLIVQLLFGAATLLTLGPIVMQLGHLLLADAVWIAFVMMAANYYAIDDPAKQPNQA